MVVAAADGPRVGRDEAERKREELRGPAAVRGIFSTGRIRTPLTREWGQTIGTPRRPLRQGPDHYGPGGRHADVHQGRSYLLAVASCVVVACEQRPAQVGDGGVAAGEGFEAEAAFDGRQDGGGVVGGVVDAGVWQGPADSQLDTGCARCIRIRKANRCLVLGRIMRIGGVRVSSAGRGGLGPRFDRRRAGRSLLFSLFRASPTPPRPVLSSERIVQQALRVRKDIRLCLARL
jgi:hypothetical protein